MRLRRFTGRSDDMLIIRGVNVFPSQIEALLLEQKALAPHYQIVVTREDNLDQLEVRVELSEISFSDEVRKLQSLERTLRKSIKEFLGVSAKITLVNPRTLDRSEGKAIRVIDRRVLS
jgi:phenylacetate-CoA ligase